MDSSRQFISALEYVQIVNYVETASIAMLSYDYFLTISREIALIWLGRRTYMKYLYLLARYVPFGAVALNIYRRSIVNANASVCLVSVKAISWLVYAVFALSEIVLTLRTWAVWNRDRRLSIGLPVFFVLFWSSAVAVIKAYLDDIKSVPVNGIPGLTCLLMESSRTTFWCWVLLLIYEAGIFSLMLIQAIRLYKHGGNSKLFDVVFRDGSLYCLTFFALGIANVIVNAVESDDIQTVLIFAECVIRTIVACRVILDIRSEVFHGANNASLSETPLAILMRIPNAIAQQPDDRCAEQTSVIDITTHNRLV